MKNQFPIVFRRIFGFSFAFILCVCHIHAQLEENFSDGDFTMNPTWVGDTNDFIVNDDDRLQLFDDDVSGSSAYLSTTAQTKGVTTWEFWVNMDFSPSSSNFSKVYLAFDNPNLNLAGNGYYIKVGGISQNEDAIELFRQDGTNSTLLISGLMGGVGTDNVTVRIRVIRDENSNWTLLTDLLGDDDFIDRGSALDDTYDLLNHFGFVCEYTSTRSEAFQFDEIFIDPLYVDEMAPQILSVEVLENDKIELVFSESIQGDFSQAEFTCDQGISLANPFFSSSSEDRIRLDNSPSFINAESYTVTVSGIKDLAGNLMLEEAIAFTYFKEDYANPYELIITELMVDPRPSIGLPEAEYIELYNNGERYIQLNFHTISSGGTPVQLPSYLLAPNDYVSLVNAEDINLFDEVSNPLAVIDLPKLTNTADEVVLASANNGSLVYSVFYTDDWYKDPSKKEGGYSLEMINIGASCLGVDNWSASTSLIGGTPGKENANSNFELDESFAQLLSVFPLDKSTLILKFDKSLDINSAVDDSNYSILNGPLITSLNLLPTTNEIELILENDLEEGRIYNMIIKGIADCNGNITGENQTLDFGLPMRASAGDLLINELLFNPSTNGVDFVEFVNVSEKIIDASTLIIGNVDETGNNSNPILVETLIFPGDFFVLSPSVEILSGFYEIKNPSFLHENTLPSFNDDSGNVTLYTSQFGLGEVIDAFDYDKDFHNDLLADKNGISLERISKTSATNDPGNWHSSAAANGYATPTYENSQFQMNPDLVENESYEIINKTFSPDGDGYKDFMQLSFKQLGPGKLATIKLFDQVGREVKTLANNELIASSGTFLWDGSSNENEMLRMGIYIMWVQIFSPDGGVSVFKEPIVLAKKL